MAGKQPCRNFLSGECLNGDDCTFSHEQEQPPQSKKPCRNFLSGKCLNGDDCTFSHVQQQPPSPKKPCRNFLSGNCLNGDDCTFSHEQQQPPPPKKPCRNFLSGNCLNGDDCTFSHEQQQPPPPKKPCRNFLSGNCLNGDDCTFSHEQQQPPPPKKPCRNFLSGNCLNGDDCTFSHEQQQPPPPKKPCRNFLSGNCLNGDDCTFSHEQQQPPPPKKPCRNFLSGNCLNGDVCTFSHEQQQPPQSKKPCTKFRSGNCTKGAACPFAHEDSVRSGTQNGSGSSPQFSKPPCYKYKAGNCTKGAACAFAHVDPASPGKNIKQAAKLEERLFVPGVRKVVRKYVKGTAPEDLFFVTVDPQRTKTAVAKELGLPTLADCRVENALENNEATAAFSKKTVLYEGGVHRVLNVTWADPVTYTLLPLGATNEQKVQADETLVKLWPTEPTSVSFSFTSKVPKFLFGREFVASVVKPYLERTCGKVYCLVTEGKGWRAFFDVRVSPLAGVNAAKLPAELDTPLLLRVQGAGALTAAFCSRIGLPHLSSSVSVSSPQNRFVAITREDTARICKSGDKTGESVSTATDTLGRDDGSAGSSPSVASEESDDDGDDSQRAWTILQRMNIAIAPTPHHQVDTDVLLAWLKSRLQEASRSNDRLNVILSSATMNTERFKTYFSISDEISVQVLKVSGRTYPLQWRFEKNSYFDYFKTYAEHVVAKVRAVVKDLPDPEQTLERDILVFLPTAQDCIRIAATLNNDASLASVVAHPLHSDLTLDEQEMVLAPDQQKIKVILATSIAETAVTIHGVVAVIDTGIGYQSVYNVQTKLLDRRLGFISRSSVMQRAGRAGRTCAGTVLCLYTEEQYRSFCEESVPHMLSSDPTEFVLTLHTIYSPCDKFVFESFIDPPLPAAVKHSLEMLQHFEVLKPTQRGTVMTDRGHAITRLLGELKKDGVQKPSLRHAIFLERCEQKGIGNLGRKVVTALVADRDGGDVGSDINAALQAIHDKVKRNEAVLGVTRTWLNDRGFAIAAGNQHQSNLAVTEALTYAFPDNIVCHLSSAFYAVGKRVQCTLLPAGIQKRAAEGDYFLGINQTAADGEVRCTMIVPLGDPATCIPTGYLSTFNGDLEYVQNHPVVIPEKPFNPYVYDALRYEEGLLGNWRQHILDTVGVSPTYNDDSREVRWAVPNTGLRQFESIWKQEKEWVTRYLQTYRDLLPAHESLGTRVVIGPGYVVESVLWNPQDTLRFFFKGVRSEDPRAVLLKLRKHRGVCSVTLKQEGDDVNGRVYFTNSRTAQAFERSVNEGTVSGVQSGSLVSVKDTDDSAIRTSLTVYTAAARFKTTVTFTTKNGAPPPAVAKHFDEVAKHFDEVAANKTAKKPAQRAKPQPKGGPQEPVQKYLYTGSAQLHTKAMEHLCGYQVKQVHQEETENDTKRTRQAIERVLRGLDRAVAAPMLEFDAQDDDDAKCQGWTKLIPDTTDTALLKRVDLAVRSTPYDKFAEMHLCAVFRVEGMVPVRLPYRKVQELHLFLKAVAKRVASEARETPVYVKFVVVKLGSHFKVTGSSEKDVTAAINELKSSVVMRRVEAWTPEERIRLNGPDTAAFVQRLEDKYKQVAINVGTTCFVILGPEDGVTSAKAELSRVLVTDTGDFWLRGSRKMRLVSSSSEVRRQIEQAGCEAKMEMKGKVTLCTVTGPAHAVQNVQKEQLKQRGKATGAGASCFVCLDDEELDIELHCGHMVCTDCAQGWFDNMKDNNEEFRCGHCKDPLYVPEVQKIASRVGADMDAIKHAAVRRYLQLGGARACRTIDCCGLLQKGVTGFTTCAECQALQCPSDECDNHTNQKLTCADHQQNVKRAMQNDANYRLSEELLKSSKRCPKCKAPSYKASGCNAMRCKCGCAWCYLCGVDCGRDAHPHFGVKGTACYSQLFEGYSV
ncbi:putative pre-mRNA-splicing factor ATP-dependent RNA helicase prp43 [Diplonema papillatum]|nr:putative pre-mRNA-splicing factor ATP-dependent RNA helicase prp43 [Diplonema papillatum]